MPTATIKIFLVHGAPKRLRTAEISNWTGKAVAGPRSEFDELLLRPEAEGSGVYFLSGVDPDTGNPALYIGEAESIKARVKAHVNRDFWNQAVFFISKDENLTKSHIRYLEGELIERATNAGRAIVVNSNRSSAKLPESDREDMKIFLGKIDQLLPVLGIDLLIPVSEKEQPSHKRTQLYYEIKSYRASGYRVPNGFLVQRGSEAVPKERPSVRKWPWPRNMRKKLAEEGHLVSEGNRLLFTADVEFSSPSAAAAVVHGGHANGLTAWKTAEGKTLKDLETE